MNIGREIEGKIVTIIIKNTVLHNLVENKKPHSLKFFPQSKVVHFDLIDL
jgi:hypothetical protein